MSTVKSIPQFNPQSQFSPMKFGSFAGGATAMVDSSFSTIQKNRTREMLTEDLLGFGVIRTFMDLFRQYFFKKDDTNQRQLNIPAARERLIREMGSIFTDNFSGGLIAYSLAELARRKLPNCANQFASSDTLSLFQTLAKKAPSEQAFYDALGKIISQGYGDRIAPEAISQILQAGEKQKIQEQAVQLVKGLIEKAKATGQSQDALEALKTLDVKLPQLDGMGETSFQLDTLLEDASKFGRFIRSKVSSAAEGEWGVKAAEILQNTLKISHWRIPLGLGLAMTMTMSVPYLNRWITEKIDGIDSYPGAKGLRPDRSVKEDQGKSWHERWFPFLSKSLKSGNPLPLLGSLIPLPFALGLFDTTKLSNGGLKALGEAFTLNVLRNRGFKAFLGSLGRIFEFGKGFPFTTQNQMAACFAFLIFSRLTTSRDDIEYRERFVDSLLGWSVWILATPAIKRVAAKLLDPGLLKQLGNTQVLKRRVEVQEFMEQGAGKSIYEELGKLSPLGKYVLLGAASTVLTIALLGIVEPYIAIKWTEWQARRSKSKEPQNGEANSQGKQPNNQPGYDPGIMPPANPYANIPASPWPAYAPQNYTNPYGWYPSYAPTWNASYPCYIPAGTPQGVNGFSPYAYPQQRYYGQ